MLGDVGAKKCVLSIKQSYYEHYKGVIRYRIV